MWPGHEAPFLTGRLSAGDCLHPGSTGGSLHGVQSQRLPQEKWRALLRAACTLVSLLNATPTLFACHAVLATHLLSSFFLPPPPSSPSPFSSPSLLPFFLSLPFLHCHFPYSPLSLLPPLSFLLTHLPFTDIYLHDGGGMFSIIHCHLHPARSCMHLLAHFLQSKTYSKTTPRKTNILHQ